MSELLTRLEGRDPTLWPAGNVSATRLGWLDVHDRMAGEAADLTSWARGIDAEHIYLLGMGGSSLGPEVLRAAAGSDRLIVVDTTDPATVQAINTDDAFFLVSSKSGSTLEVASLLAHCWERQPYGSRYAAITDPGSPLSALAHERKFARIFENPSDIGGRYSVLSYFGLVPAALCGIDVAAVCAAAGGVDREEAVALGYDMASAAIDGRDKVTIASSPEYSSFGLWVEQLIAESTGKQARGCIPVPVTEMESGADRHPITVEVASVTDLGREFLRWEIATAIAGHRLDVDPFDEPNVSESKANTDRVLRDLPVPHEPTGDGAEAVGWLRSNTELGDYVSIQAYVPYGQDHALEGARRLIRDELGGTPVTAGYGPRFLHSTGQLHKGGPNSVVAVQIVPAEPTASVAVPGQPFDFATLIAAQAAGDLRSLRDHGRRVLRVAVLNGDLSHIT